MSSPSDKLAAALAALEANADALPLDKRRELALDVRAVLRDDRTDQASINLLRLLSSDPRWEVRQAVAEVLPDVGDDEFVRLVSKLSEDGNAYVRNATERAMEQRRRGAKENNRHKRGLEAALEDLERIRRIHGPLAEKRARRAAERLFEGLVSTAVHDLRRTLTPLQHGLTSLLRHPNVGPLMKDLQRVTRNVEFMARVVEDMRTASQMIPTERQRHRLREVVDHAMVWAEDYSRTQGDITPIRTTIDVPDVLTVEIAHDTIVRAVGNVLLNAFESFFDGDRFASGEIRVQASLQNRDEVCLCVRDNGAGMSEELLQGAFVFGNSTKAKSGSGLGLTIVRRGIEAHGGTVTITSKEKHGTAVTIILPIHARGEDE